MSQVSKIPASLPLRKRLRPTVNVNVAGRRRINVKDLPSTADGNSNDRDGSLVITEHSCCSLTQDVEGTKGFLKDETISSKVLDSSFESKISVKSDASTVIIKNELLVFSEKGSNKPYHNKSVDSSASTVILTSGYDNVSDVLDKVQSKSLNNSFETDRSVSSSVSTIIFNEKDYGGTTCVEKYSRDIGKEVANSVATSLCNVISSNKHFERSSDENQQVCKLLSGLSNVRDGSGMVVDDAVSRTSDKDNGYIFNSVSARTSPVHDANCSTTDCESLMEDDTSSVVSYRSGCSMLPPKYRRRQNFRSTRLYDARKEFEAKYVNKKPERSSLRMLDLIYYNPTSNPMKSSPDSNQGVVVSISEPNDVAEEDVDDPDEQENGDEEENNRVPAPRVKVGPNGELVLDEQSLVIETTQSKKSRKEIANLTVVIDSGSNTTYHTYSKKKKRRSDWSVQETVRFYKALQSIGTDFSLMQSLFPSRSRVDLKTKYKREEKINGHLIEKALRFPSLFDLSELEKEEKEVQVKENEISQRSNKAAKGKKRALDLIGFDDKDSKHLKLKKKRKTQTQKTKTLSQRNGSNEVNQEVKENLDDCSDDEYRPVTRVEEVKNHECANTRPKRVSDDNRPNYAAIENGDAYSDSEVNVLKIIEIEHYSHSDEKVEEELEDVNTLVEEEEVEAEQQLEEVEMGDASHDTVVENGLGNLPISLEGIPMTNVQPGSIVLLTTQCPDNPDYQICNVFMVQDKPTVCHQSDMSSNINNCLSLTSSIINSSNINSTGETQPS